MRVIYSIKDHVAHQKIFNMHCSVHHKKQIPETRQAFMHWAAVWHLTSGWNQWGDAQLPLWTELSWGGIFRELLWENYEVLFPFYSMYVHGLHQPHIYVTLRLWRIHLSMLLWRGETKNFQGCLSLVGRAGGIESSRERRKWGVAHWWGLSFSSNSRGAGDERFVDNYCATAHSLAGKLSLDLPGAASPHLPPCPV